jgi:hypothetical protein
MLLLHFKEDYARGDDAYQQLLLTSSIDWTRLISKLIEAVMQGEEIIIAKAGKPAARLVPYVSKKNRVNLEC